MCRILDARCRATAAAQGLREGACAAWCLSVAQQAQEHALSLEEGFLLQPAAGRLLAHVLACHVLAGLHRPGPLRVTGSVVSACWALALKSIDCAF